MRILIAEADEFIREMLTKVLYALEPGCVVKPVADYTSAVKELEVGSFDVLIVAYTIQGLRGISLVTHARTHYPKLSIIFMTSSGDKYRTQAFDAGADYYFRKAIDNAPVVLREAMARAESQRDPH